MTARPISDTAPVQNSRVGYRLLIVTGSVAAAVLVWGVASLFGESLVVTSPAVGTISIGLVLVIATALPVALAAWGVLALLQRWTRNAPRIWIIVSVAILLVAVVSVLAITATPGVKLTLAVMHLAVGLPLAFALPRGSRGRARTL